jgi:hypothetical protein
MNYLRVIHKNFSHGLLEHPVHLKQLLGVVVYGFIDNFRHYVLIIKKALIAGIIEKKIQKYQQRNSLWDTE